MGTKICRSCNAENNGQSRFCRECGNSLDDVSGPARLDYGSAPTDIIAGGGSGKGKTVVDGAVHGGAQPTPKPAPAGQRNKQHTVIGGGLANSDRAGAIASRQLIGVLATFDPTDKAAGRFFPLYEGRTIIGREVDSDEPTVIIPEDNRISKQHATILWRNDKLIIADKMSLNNTYVDEATLKFGQKSHLVHGTCWVRKSTGDNLFRGQPTRLYCIDDEQVQLGDNSLIAVGDTIFQIRMFGWIPSIR